MLYVSVKVVLVVVKFIVMLSVYVGICMYSSLCYSIVAHSSLNVLLKLKVMQLIFYCRMVYLVTVYLLEEIFNCLLFKVSSLLYILCIGAHSSLLLL